MTDKGSKVVRVCARADVQPGTVRAFAVGSNTLAVYNIDGAYYVTDDECTHAAASLAGGFDTRAVLLEDKVKARCSTRKGIWDDPGRSALR